MNLTKAPSEYVKKLYFDTVVFTEHQLRYLIETWGADHIVMGTDYPYDMAETDPVGHEDSGEGSFRRGQSARHGWQRRRAAWD